MQACKHQKILHFKQCKYILTINDLANILYVCKNNIAVRRVNSLFAKPSLLYPLPYYYELNFEKIYIMFKNYYIP